MTGLKAHAAVACLALAALFVGTQARAQSTLSIETTPVPCNASVVTQGGTAVVAIKGGSITTQAVIVNPANAVNGESIYIDDTGTPANGTGSPTSFAIVPGQEWTSGPISTPVSVWAATSGHLFNCQVQ